MAQLQIPGSDDSNSERDTRDFRGYWMLFGMFIAVAGLAILIGLPWWLARDLHAKTRQVKTSLACIDFGLKMYEMRFAQYPPDLLTLDSAGFIMPGIEVDPWGNIYGYQLRGKSSPDVFSKGRDGKPGGTGRDADLR